MHSYEFIDQKVAESRILRGGGQDHSKDGVKPLNLSVFAVVGKKR